MDHRHSLNAARSDGARLAGIKAAALALALLGSPALAQAPYAAAGPPIAGIPQPEDLVAIPDSKWLVVGSMRSREAPGHLYLIDTQAAAPALTPLYPSKLAPDLDASRFAGCPGPLDDSRFTPHGINVARDPKGGLEIIAINHGGRESIEVFAVTMVAGAPQARWRGCVPLPANASGNGVTASPTGGYIVTNFLDKSDPTYLQKMAAGAVTGNVLQWRRDAGWSDALPQKFSGANGVAVTADGRWLFVSEWSAKKIWKFPLRGKAKPRSVTLDFLPDNLRLTSQGDILIAGQDADPVDVMTCKSKQTPCPPRFKVVSMKPDAMSTRLLAQGGDSSFGGATGAALTGETLWIGSYYGDRLARYTRARR